MPDRNTPYPRFSNDLLTVLTKVDDPRLERTRFHKLEDILAISICATLCGADSFTDFALFGKIPVILGAYAAKSGLALGQLKLDEKTGVERRYFL